MTQNTQQENNMSPDKNALNMIHQEMQQMQDQLANQNLLSGLEQDSLDMSMDIQQRTSELITPQVIDASAERYTQFDASSSVNVADTSEVVSVATPNVDIT